MEVFVVIKPALGWDSVVDVLTDEKVAEHKYGEKEEYIIHSKTLNKETYKKIYEKEIKHLMKETDYFKVKDKPLLEDALVISYKNEFFEENSQKSMDFYANKFLEFCGEESYDCGKIYLSKYKNESGWLLHSDISIWEPEGEWKEEVWDKWNEWKDKKGIETS